MAVHRVIEARAASQGDAIAIDSGVERLSYRELNQQANAVARLLVANGFRRGSLAAVRMPRSIDTAIVLLGILKAGGMFVQIDEDGAADISCPRGVSFGETADNAAVRYRAVDVLPALQRSAMCSANLPILSRATDVACAIPDRDGAPLVLVPHEAILALQDKPVPSVAEWVGEAGALDLWMALMTGATVTVGSASLQTVAA